MTFFRIKKIKGKEYAYIVENEWKKNGSRQKVKGYLGRAYKFSLVNDIAFSKYHAIGNIQNYIESNDNKKIINDLIEWELFKFDIKEEETSIDLENIKIQKKKKNVSLLINDGFICSFTLNRLFNFKPEGDEQADGYRFAKAFVEAGIKVPQEVFIGLFGKMYNSKSI